MEEEEETSEKLKRYIEKELGKGFPLEKIRNALIQAGHKKELIKDVIASLGEETIPKREKPKPLTIILIVLVALIIIIVVSFPVINLPSRETPVKPTSRIPPEELKKMIMEGAEAGLNACLNTKVNPILCEAFMSEDLEQCNQIADEDYRFYCQDIIHIKKAVKNRDSKICEGVNGPLFKSGCLALISGDSKECDGLPNEEKIICAAVYAEQDEKLCDQIKEPRKYECIFMVNLIKAKETEDVSVCNNIPEGKQRVQCIAFIEEDSTYCEDILKKDTDLCYDVYYNDLADNFKDKSYCQNIKDNELKESCLSR